MCKTKMATDAIPPISPSPRPSSRHHPKPISSTSDSSTTNTASARNAAAFTSSSSSVSSRHSLSSLRSSLPENPHLYDVSEIRSATNNFLSKTHHTSSSWRCTLHGKDVIIFQRKCLFQQTLHSIKLMLSSICRSHHSAIANLLGASLSGDYIYLVYEFVNGASLADLLHANKNPEFTPLNTWMSRMRIASDLADGLDYIHNNTGLDVTFVHNHIKASSVIVTEPSFNAKICHFGTAQLCGEPVEHRDQLSYETKIPQEEDEIVAADQKPPSEPKQFRRSNSLHFSGTRGYMPPEFQAKGVGTRKSDVYAFGVVLLELLSGEEPVKYKFDKKKKEYRKISVVDAAKAVVEEGGEEREGRLRSWVDKRLKDSFPVDVALKLTRLALECVHVEPDKRPDMRRVAGKISRLYLESQASSEKMKIPTEFTVSFAPR